MLARLHQVDLVGPFLAVVPYFGMCPLILAVLNREIIVPLMIILIKDCSYKGEHPKPYLQLESPADLCLFVLVWRPRKCCKSWLNLRLVSRE